MVVRKSRGLAADWLFRTLGKKQTDSQPDLKCAAVVYINCRSFGERKTIVAILIHLWSLDEKLKKLRQKREARWNRSTEKLSSKAERTERKATRASRRNSHGNSY